MSIYFILNRIQVTTTIPGIDSLSLHVSYLNVIISNHSISFREVYLPVEQLITTTLILLG